MRVKARNVFLAVALAASAAACESSENADPGDSGNPNNVQDDMTATPDDGSNNVTPDMGPGPDTATPDTGGPDDMNVPPDAADPDMGVASPWTVSAHPCVGNRTDALWCDDDQTCFAGCGTTTTGFGLFATTDGGATWSAPATTPGGFFDTGRVNDIWRGATGSLFISGEFPNSTAVVAMDAAGMISEVYTRGNMVGNSFTVGNFRRASNGYAIAESLNGSGVLTREMDGGDPTASWTSARFWADGDADDTAFGVQILDMAVFNDQFWAVGSTISQPPIVFTPKWVAGDFDFGIVPLVSGLAAFDGEMWGIDVNADGVVVGGVNQGRDVGMIFTLTSGDDETDATAWKSFDVSTLFAGAKTWVTDVCRAPNNVVYATGRESAQGWGFVLRSADGGTTFTDISPYDSTGNPVFDDVSRCQSFSDGVIVVGAGGMFARFR